MLFVIAATLLADEPLNDKVVTFARAQIGRQVGDGECTALANAALKSAGARRPSRSAWGEERAALKDAQPGDILQFENAVFHRTRTFPDGAVASFTIEYPHHTAIVSRVRKRGRRPVLVILHQNASVNGDDDETRKVVKEWVVNLAELRSGTIKAYRPTAE